MYEVNHMAYRVQYSAPERRKIGLAWTTAVFLTVFVLLVGLFWPEGANVLRDLLIPGDPAVTAAALEQFAAEMRGGTSWREALTLLWQRVAVG